MGRHFRLQALLAHRASRLDLARSELATAQRHFELQLNHIDRLLEAEGSIMGAQMTLLPANPIDLPNVRNSYHQLAGLREAIAKARVVASSLAQELERKRQAAVEAQQQHKVIVRLKERHAAREQDAERRNEVKVNDEIAIAQAALGRSGA